MPSRPLLEKSIAELEAMARRNQANAAELSLIEAELTHRHTARALTLGSEISRRILDLTAKPATDAPAANAPKSTAAAEQRAAWVRQAVAGLRTKLIDLSKRNPLIAFKHSERGASYLRVVDERPDVLFKTLREGDMRFEPLPDEDETPADERTDEFRIAYERARLTDTAYLAALENLGEAEDDAAALQSAERALRATVRDVLGLPRLERV